MVPPLSSIILASPKSAILTCGGIESVKSTFYMAQVGCQPCAKGTSDVSRRGRGPYLRLEVAVRDALPVAVGHADTDLTRYVLRLGLRHAGVGRDAHNVVE